MDEYERLMLKNRRPWYYIASILIILSAFVRIPLVLLAGIFTLLVGIVPELWYRQALRHLTIRQHVNQRHLFFGERVTLSLTIENRKFLPLTTLQTENAITPALTITRTADKWQHDTNRDRLVSTWLLWSFQRVTRRYRMYCHARGFHIFGPIKLYCSDPFGWLERELYVAANETLLVYPLIAPIDELGLPAVLLPGERVGPRKLLEDPLWFAGIRAYELGDDPRRIDWKATARVGELRSKLYESTTVHRLLVLLDTWTYAKALNKVDTELQEFAISVAASLAMWGLDEGYMVGLLSNSAMAMAAQTISTEGNTDEPEHPARVLKSSTISVSSPGVSVPFSLEYTQYEQLLTTLAQLLPHAHTPLEHVLETERAMFQPGTTIVLVGSANTVSEQTLELLYEQRLHGNTVSLMLVGDVDEEQAIAQYSLPAHYVGGKEKWHELIKTVDEANGTSSTHLQLD